MRFENKKETNGKKLISFNGNYFDNNPSKLKRGSVKKRGGVEHWENLLHEVQFSFS